MGCFGFFSWSSPLSFFPIPWPDDSAFFLPGLDWVNFPPRYLMRAQAAFVPEYLEANFNTMPFLPTLMGISARIGLDTTHAIRFFGFLVLTAWAMGLAYWMKIRKVPPLWIWMVAWAALLSPVIRWGATLTRPEVWIGALWLLLLWELDGKSVFAKLKPLMKLDPKWRAPILLALGASIHFEAVIWVLPFAIGLFDRDLKVWGSRLWEVAWRTALLLSPWVLYGLLNWDLFWTQMNIQFGRLSTTNAWIQSLHGLFHYLFHSTGNPIDYPKFLNLGKALTWIALLLGVVLNLKPAQPIRLAVAAGILVSLFLALKKPEVWFITLVHMALWPALLLLLPKNLDFKVLFQNMTSVDLARLLSFVGLLLLVGIETGVAARQYWMTRTHYSWDRFEEWIECIDRKIGERQEVWQPTSLDALVNLAGRNEERNYTRHNDFPGTEGNVQAYMARAQAIIHTHALPIDQPLQLQNYEGGARSMDLYYLKEWPWMTARRYSAPYLGSPWKLEICQKGPFWAALSLR